MPRVRYFGREGEASRQSGEGRVPAGSSVSMPPGLPLKPTVVSGDDVFLTAHAGTRLLQWDPVRTCWTGPILLEKVSPCFRQYSTIRLVDSLAKGVLR